ncbi:MAG: T9SS type A sorting domain-containing protein [Lewinellaceae bacterium]|nr:T9SS type A sorting domain-containing protein [Lewinellaceae bacterium]
MNQITSWRFVPDTYVFPNPNVPWGFPEQINLTGVTSNTSGHDFKGIKLGDVVSTWANPANFGAGEPMVLRVQDQVLQAGQEVSIDFHVDQFADLNSFQFALYFDPEQLALLEIEPLGGLPVSMGNFGTFNIDGGELRVVWAQASPIMITEAAQLFRLRFQALETGALLRNVLQLNEDVLPAYAYNSAYEESGVQLRFVETSATTNPDQAAGLHLEAWPNPFAESTLLRFNLPQDGEAELRVFDAAGRVLFSKKQYYSAGSYSETFQAEAAPAGVWFAEIRSASGNLVLPLIRVEPK